MSRSFKRPQPTLPLRPKIIVACEDSKSSRFYLKRIQQVHRLTSVEFILLEHEGTDPRTIVRQVAERIRLEKRQKAWADDKDEGWAIFDGDEHQQTPGQRQNWNAAIQQANALGIQLGIFNPSVEFWYLLHFQHRSVSLTRQQALDELRKFYPRYEKQLSMYDDLRNKTNTAIQRAQALLSQAQQNGVDPHDNPCCAGFAVLVERLINLK